MFKAEGKSEPDVETVALPSPENQTHITFPVVAGEAKEQFLLSLGGACESAVRTVVLFLLLSLL